MESFSSVTEYVTSSGTLKLQHAHNATDSKASSAIVALVDIELLLETIKATDMHVGAWVNVIGYVDAGARVSRRVAGTGKDQGIDVKIQAVMLWSAGSIRIGDYEQALQGRRGLD